MMKKVTVQFPFFCYSYICNIHFKCDTEGIFISSVKNDTGLVKQLLKSTQLDILFANLLSNCGYKCWSLTRCWRGEHFYTCSYVQKRQEVQVQ